MTRLLSIFADDTLPILVAASVGFLLARYLPADVKTLLRATFNALAPRRVFNLLVTSKISAGEFGRIVYRISHIAYRISLIATRSTQYAIRDTQHISRFNPKSQTPALPTGGLWLRTGASV